MSHLASSEWFNRDTHDSTILESNAPEQRQHEKNIKQLTIEKSHSTIKINNHM